MQRAHDHAVVLGGQASQQWTPEPADVVVHAIEVGVSLLDTSNMYGRAVIASKAM